MDPERAHGARPNGGLRGAQLVRWGPPGALFLVILFRLALIHPALQRISPCCSSLKTPRRPPCPSQALLPANGSDIFGQAAAGAGAADQAGDLILIWAGWDNRWSYLANALLSDCYFIFFDIYCWSKRVRAPRKFALTDTHDHTHMHVHVCQRNPCDLSSARLQPETRIRVT